MLHTEKCCRDITYWGRDMKNIPNTEVQVATSKTKLQQEVKLSGNKPLLRQNFLGRDRNEDDIRQCCNIT